MTYIITFFTHYDAMACKNYLKKMKIQGTLMPVPRTLSSSCGTCLNCDTKDQKLPLDHFAGEEGVSEVFLVMHNGTYELVLKND